MRNNGCVPNHVHVLGVTKVAEGSKYDGKAADVWSCAVVLFNMLAGFFPSEADAAKVGKTKA